MNDQKKEEVERFLNRTREVYLSWGNLQNPGVVRDAMLHRLHKTDLSRPVLVPKWLIPATLAADFAFIGIGTITAVSVTTALTAIAVEIVLFGSSVFPLLWPLMELL